MASSRPHRQIFDIEGHAHFVTFSCYHNLPLLSRDQCKRIILGNLDTLAPRHEIGVVGYVIMPNHIHILLRPINAGLLSEFLQQWKRLTSNAIQDFLGLGTPADSTPFGSRVRDGDGSIHIWQKRYYGFNIFTAKKAIEKLEYMHSNPVRAGLVKEPTAWPWSSAGYYLIGRATPVHLVAPDGPIILRGSERKGSEKPSKS